MSTNIEKFLSENPDQLLDHGATKFIAVGKDDCPVGSECEGYNLNGTYKLGANAAGTVTSAAGEPLLVLDFNLKLKDANPENSYNLIFGFENGEYTESGSFFRGGVDKEIHFRSKFEKGDLEGIRNNGVDMTADFHTWTGEAKFDEKNKLFSATSYRPFKHNIPARSLKLGTKHRWGTRFTVKDKDQKQIASGESGTMTMILENFMSGNGASNL